MGWKIVPCSDICFLCVFNLIDFPYVVCHVQKLSLIQLFVAVYLPGAFFALELAGRRETRDSCGVWESWHVSGPRCPVMRETTVYGR